MRWRVLLSSYYLISTLFVHARRHLVLNCEGDLHIFPFDSPMCTFAIESGELQTNIHSIYTMD